MKWEAVALRGIVHMKLLDQGIHLSKPHYLEQNFFQNTGILLQELLINQCLVRSYSPVF